MKKSGHRRKTGEDRQPVPIKLDPFQEKAIAALLAGRSVLVAAPTGTGKTLIAEKLLEKILAEDKGAVYTSPLKALSNQKYRDFCRLFGGSKTGLITGDLSINEKAPLLVMTTEIFRNWCFANPEMLSGTSHVIFDEMHFLDDPERGTTWEESIIFAPGHIKILGLSATVPNIREIAVWMEGIRGGKVTVIVEKKRAVPLKMSWLSPSGDVLDEAQARAEVEARREARRGVRAWSSRDVRLNSEELRPGEKQNGRI